MKELNIHSEYIDKRIKKIIENKKKWKTKIIDTSHEDFIKDCSVNIFTNLIKDTFTKAYLKKFPCSDCGDKSIHRCHSVGAERPKLIKLALEKVWKDTSKPIMLKEIIIAFLEIHKYTQFTFKCVNCHQKETKKIIIA